ncbi:hypothetical protein D9M69_535100 [compost metagenome]
MQTRQTGRQRVTTGSTTGKQTLLAIDRLQQQLASEQIVGQARLLAVAKEQLSGQQRLRYQLTAQLPPLLLGQHIERRKTAQLLGVQGVVHGYPGSAGQDSEDAPIARVHDR